MCCKENHKVEKPQGKTQGGVSARKEAVATRNLVRGGAPQRKTHYWGVVRMLEQESGWRGRQHSAAENAWSQGFQESMEHGRLRRESSQKSH